MKKTLRQISASLRVKALSAPTAIEYRPQNRGTTCCERRFSAHQQNCFAVFLFTIVMRRV